MNTEKESDGVLGDLARAIDGSFAIQKIGEEIRLCSATSPTRVFIIVALRETSGRSSVFELIKHRSLELTKAHKGKIVSDSWIVSFTQSNAEIARRIEEITFERLPSDCEILKETEVKKVVRDQLGTVVTVFRDGVPQLPPERYDGTATRGWERSTLGVTNWYYDSR